MTYYPERARTRTEDILIEQFIAQRGVTHCPDTVNQTRTHRFGGALPADLDPVPMGDPQTIDVARAVREYEAETAIKRRRFEVLTGGKIDA